MSIEQKVYFTYLLSPHFQFCSLFKVVNSHDASALLARLFTFHGVMTFSEEAGTARDILIHVPVLGR